MDIDIVNSFHGENKFILSEELMYELCNPYQIIHERIFKDEYDHIPGFDKVIDMIIDEIELQETIEYEIMQQNHAEK